jgi:hypothetical protein
LSGSSLPPGSVLRIAALRPLPPNGFLAGSKFAALFQTAPFLGFLLQGLPLARDRLRLSTQPGFLVVILRRAWTHDSSPFTCGFADVHAFTQLPGSPAGYELPFHAPKHASRLPWVSRRGTTPFRQHHPLRSFDPSCESVRDWVGFPLPNRPIPSWLSAPLELSPPTPRILYPPRLEA